jgi:MoaA/NifB/PqqE/SkfB family radical SAM enzyme
MAELGGRERTADEWIHMAGELLDAGTIGLLLTGGEPMLRPDFIKIYREIAQMGFMLTLYTNATLITYEIFEVLKEYPPHSIGVTVYGASPETYEKVTGNANAYYRMLEGVELLRKLPSRLTIRTTLIKDNVEDLDKITEWAFGLGSEVQFNVSRIVTKPVRGGIADVEACRLTPEQNVAMLNKRSKDLIITPFQKFIKENPQIIRNNRRTDRDAEPEERYEDKKEHKSQEKRLTLYGCEAGMSSFTITWDGKLIGCQLLGDCWTYPFEEGFKKAWEDFPEKVVIPPVPEQCMSCRIPCNSCPATRLAETGSMCGFPEYLCREGKLAKDMHINLHNELQQIKNRKDD